jgi:serine protease Do
MVRSAGKSRTSRLTLRSLAGVVICASLAFVWPAERALADSTDMIAKVKQSIVAVGTYERTRNPAFTFSGTGFVVGDGLLVVTNAHVLPPMVEPARRETIVVAIPSPNAGIPAQVRPAKALLISLEYDIAVLGIEGLPLAALPVSDSAGLKEGQDLLFTGFPMGIVLGLFPATNRAMVSAIAPIALAGNSAGELDAKTIKRLASNPYPIVQLDATAYPGNSGSPLYNPATGEVVGIINMVFVKGTKESAITQPSGITYAIPAKPLSILLKSLQK